MKKSYSQQCQDDDGEKCDHRENKRAILWLIIAILATLFGLSRLFF